MTRKDSSKSYVLGGIALSIAVLIVLVALAALAQMPGAGRSERGPLSHLQKRGFAAGPMPRPRPFSFWLLATIRVGAAHLLGR
jgi:hypothetical protein